MTTTSRRPSGSKQGQIPADADLPLAARLLPNVLRKPAQDEATVAALVAHVLRSLGAESG